MRHERPARRPLQLAHALCRAALCCCGLLAAWGVGESGARAQEGAMTRGAKPEAEPKVTVYGRAVYEGTDRPVRRARLLLLGIEKDGGQTVGLTNERGEFRLTGVEAGRYVATVDAPGILSPASYIAVEQVRGDMPDLSEVRRHFEEIVVDGKSDVRVTVRAVRGAAVSGRVTYADGEPAIGLALHVFQRRPNGALGKVLPGLSTSAMSAYRTDDRGLFRAAGLPAGEYVVAVSEEAAHADRGEGRHFYDDVRGDFFRPRLLMTFHPSATRVSEATAVKVAAGDEREGVDITVAERPLRTVGGVVRARRDRRPLARARVSLSRRDEGLRLSGPTGTYESVNVTETDGQGRWQFRDIPDGSYTVSVVPSTEYEEEPAPATGTASGSSRATLTRTQTDGAAGAGSGNRPRRPVIRYALARRAVEVAGDVEDLSIELSAGARVSGTIGVEGAAGSAADCGSLILVRLPEASDEYEGERAEPQTLSASDFSFNGLRPGKYFVRTAADHCTAAVRPYARSVTFNGRDLLREPLEVAEGAELDGVRVSLSMNPARLRVRVLSSPGGEAHRGNVAVLLIPAGEAGQWSRYAPRDFSCYTSGGPECEVSAAPGDYVVVAVPAAGSSPPAEDAVRALAAAAPRVTLTAGESRTVEAVVRGR